MKMEEEGATEANVLGNLRSSREAGEGLSAR